MSEIIIEAIPGPSAFTAALSIAGMATSQFTFLGFPPVKKGRRAFFNSLAESPYPSVLYESPHRILKTLAGIKESTENKRVIFVGRELTKLHEEGVRGTVDEVLAYFTEHKDHVRGEFVIIVEVKK